jgi:Mitochondrial carrier protein
MFHTQKFSFSVPCINSHFSFFRDIRREESSLALFNGLGPTLVGVVPVLAISFFMYGNGKRLIVDKFNVGRENSWVHLSASDIAGIITGTATKKKSYSGRKNASSACSWCWVEVGIASRRS